MFDPKAIERVRLLTEELEARGAQYVNPGATWDSDRLAVADLREVLRELRHLRARAVDSDDAYLVTVKLPRNPLHDPRNKHTGPCLFSDECSDAIGEHHTLLTNGEGVERQRASGVHITRVEKLGRTPDFLRERS